MPSGVYPKLIEQRRKMSESHKGMKKPWSGRYKHTEEQNRKISEAKKGKLSNAKGKHWKLSSTTRKKMSERRGEKNPNWKGGITPENLIIRERIEYKLWRIAVFERDSWTCQKYGIRGKRLAAHHIYNFALYPELRFAIDNGITLSEKAHKEFHKIYGNRNNTKEQLQEFLSKIE